jgi:hypothetical protein
MRRSEIARFNMATAIKDFGERHNVRFLVRIGYRMRYRSLNHV